MTMMTMPSPTAVLSRREKNLAFVRVGSWIISMLILALLAVGTEAARNPDDYKCMICNVGQAGKRYDCKAPGCVDPRTQRPRKVCATCRVDITKGHHNCVCKTCAEGLFEGDSPELVQAREELARLREESKPLQELKKVCIPLLTGMDDTDKTSVVNAIVGLQKEFSKDVGIKQDHFQRLLDAARAEANVLHRKIFVPKTFAEQKEAWKKFDAFVNKRPTELKQLGRRYKQKQKLPKFQTMQEWEFFEKALPQWSREHETELLECEREIKSRFAEQTMLLHKGDSDSARLAEEAAKNIAKATAAQNVLIKEAGDMVNAVRKHKGKDWLPFGAAFKRSALKAALGHRRVRRRLLACPLPTKEDA